MTNSSFLPGSDRLDLLHTFVRIVEAGSLSAAAAQLGTTQPTVSRRLQSLERMLGLRLIQRSTHAMKLTEDGDRCFAHARALLDNWHLIEADLRGMQDEPRGTLRVLAPHAFGQGQLIAPLVEFLNRHPAVSVEWLLHDRNPDFISEGIDCAIRVGSIEDPGLVAIRMAEVPRIVVAAPRLIDAHRPPIDASELAALPWIALRTFYRDEVQLSHAGDGRSCRFAIRPRMATDSLYALRQAACAGLGAAISSSWLVAEDIESGRLVRLTPDWEAETLPVYLVYPHARFYPARLRAFVELMRTHVPTLAGMRAPSPRSSSRSRHR
ncbi:LysR family transcriptional regulator [Methyloversatilis thermotolerans]|uniref:LysR family transcriptional regulator n=1 Tax=Methyloversatilis thermotolerans TaxID=1346290 RepID=UPI00035F10A8|nr:LysR family transcriptional regulator [Methyloversatilis thermotolerans]